MHTNILPQATSPVWHEENFTDFKPRVSLYLLSTFETFFDLTKLVFVAAILLISLLSMYFILHLSIKSRKASYLQSFNSIGTIRFLLVFLVALWGLVEVLRIPFFRHKNIHPFLPSLTLSQQADLCKIHVILSLGLFEPGFLITILFLVSVSTKKDMTHYAKGILYILIMCMPIVALQILLFAWSPLDLSLPEQFRRTSIVLSDSLGNEFVLCTNPLMGTFVFGVFGITYAIWFLFSSWKVVSLVINKGLRHRIYWLTFTVLITLPLQVFCLGISELWKPDEVILYGGLAFVEFLCTFICAIVGEDILVIRPILDSLSIGGPSCLLMPRSERLLIPRSGRSLEEGRRPLEDGNS